MRKTAIIGGIGYLVIFITGIYANFVVLETLRVPNDDLATFENLQANSGLILQAIVAFILMVVCDLILTWVLYRLFKDANTKLSFWTALLRGINALFFGGALMYLFKVWHITNGSQAAAETAANVSSALAMFDTIWLIGLVFFGVHLILLARLLCQSKHMRILIPGFLLLAGIGYLVDSMLQFFYADYISIADLWVWIVVMPGVLGELSLTGWLLIYGGRKTETMAIDATV